MTEDSLFIIEIYKSLQGEAFFAGYPCTFIRLAGCPLRCKWCDTVYGFKKGEQKPISDIIGEIKKLDCNIVEITGGEPLAQKSSLSLMKTLIDNGYKVLLETSGSISIAPVPTPVHIIMDLKCPGSGMDKHNNWENIHSLKKSDETKFVVSSKDDFDWCLSKIDKYNLKNRCHILFSPAWGLVKPASLAKWILAAKITAKLNLQQHKYIWHPRAKGV